MQCDKCSTILLDIDTECLQYKSLSKINDSESLSKINEPIVRKVIWNQNVYFLLSETKKKEIEFFINLLLL